MSAVIERTYGVVSSHDENGERSGEGTGARTDIIVGFEMNGKESAVSYTLEYIMTESGPADSSPHKFEVAQDEDGDGGWQEKMLSLSDNLDNEDPATLQAIIEESEGVLTSVDDIKSLLEFIEDERPSLWDMQSYMEDEM